MPANGRWDLTRRLKGYRNVDKECAFRKLQPFNQKQGQVEKIFYNFIRSFSLSPMRGK